MSADHAMINNVPWLTVSPHGAPSTDITRKATPNLQECYAFWCPNSNPKNQISASQLISIPALNQPPMC